MVVDTTCEEKNSLEKRNEELERENLQLREDAARLREQLADVEGQLKYLTKRMFGRRSERFENPDQLFLGSSEGGAERAETFFSLAQSCRQLGIEPFEYFVVVINRISTEPQSNIDELTPAGWKRARELAASENTLCQSAL